MSRRILLSLILLTLTTPAMANPTKLLTDLHGDRLPNGAIARFGVNRLVHTGASTWKFRRMANG